MRLFLILGTFLALMAYFSPGHLPGDRANYCEMVQIHNDTNGEYGWPDNNERMDCDD